MRITNPRHHMLKFTAIGCALLAMGLSGCNQGATPASPEAAPESANRPPMSQPTLENAIELPERALVGEELEAFLKARAKETPLNLQPHAADPSGGLGKSAANPACIIDFASPAGLSNMADRAYVYYATSPFYFQPCLPQNASVTPTKGTHYYLVPEASGVCHGTYGKMGYGTISDCRNQKDASLFPRYASNASVTDGDVGLTVQMLDAAGNPKLFRASYAFVRSGSITAYGYKPIEKKWYVWGPVQAVGFLVMQNAANLSALQFFAADKASIYQVDNISITGN